MGSLASGRPWRENEMACPDLERLLRALREERDDAEFDRHLTTCSECRENFRILREIPSLFRPVEQVPEELLRKTMDGVRALEGHPPARQVPAAQVLATAFLGLLTALFVLLGTGAGGSPGWMLLFSLAVGGACGAFRAQAGSGPWEGT